MKKLYHVSEEFKKIIRFLQNNRLTVKFIFIVTGIFSTFWFLFRVLQKPSRITYPCMQATAPVMTSFLLYIFSLGTAVFAFRKAKKSWFRSKYVLASGLFIVSVVSGALFWANSSYSGFANVNDAPVVSSLQDPRNEPVGEGYGIYNGRVVWVHDDEVTNEDCSNTSGDYWFDDENTNQEVVDKMLADGIKKITGETTVNDAWNALFRYHNKKKGRSYNGYTEGEKICIKINLTNSSYLGFDSNDKMDATPHLVLSLLKQLVEEVGVAEEDITLGDPFRTFRDIHWDKCHTVFPDVNYIDNTGQKGRILTPVTDEDYYYTSDGSFSSPIPQAYFDADYFINMPCLKSHDAAGITIGAKNHQGSVLGTGQTARKQQMGKDLHYCYPTSPGFTQMGEYRHLVDYMGNEYMGGNTVIYIVDALWTGHNWNGIVVPWEIKPFNGDWMSSLFLSQDPVAIESVGFDFLFEEYLVSADERGGNYPLYEATQDYIHQAASPANWPGDIIYDPEDDGTAIGSLGVHEHWNGVEKKQYSGNLGNTGGIHLVSVPADLVSGSENEFEKDTTANIETSVEKVNSISRFALSPNPASEFFTVSFSLKTASVFRLEMFDLAGRKVLSLDSDKHWHGKFQKSYDISRYNLGEGLYLCKLIVNSGKGVEAKSAKIKIVR